MDLIHKVIQLKNWILDLYAKKSYAQEGEDLILARIFENKNDGFYVDVGAHHPLRFSNTHLLYKKGWKGINLDVNPGSMKSFNLIRSRDINLEIGVANVIKKATYYSFNESAVNTFDKKLIQDRLDNGYFIKDRSVVKLYPLKNILKKYIKFRKIDLLTIDVEGYDFQVLQSMDWSYKPTVIIVEQLGSNLEEIANTKTYKLLNKNGYFLFAKTANSVFYIRK